MIVKESLNPVEETGNDDDDDMDGGMLDGDAAKTEKRKKRERVYLEYVLHFSSTNIMNMDKLAMGGLEYKEIEWWVEMESFSTYTFNIMRYNLQKLCITNSNEKFRDLIIR